VRCPVGVPVSQRRPSAERTPAETASATPSQPGPKPARSDSTAHRRAATEVKFSGKRLRVQLGLATAFHRGHRPIGIEMTNSTVGTDSDNLPILPVFPDLGKAFGSESHHPQHGLDDVQQGLGQGPLGSVQSRRRLPRSSATPCRSAPVRPGCGRFPPERSPGPRPLRAFANPDGFGGRPPTPNEMLRKAAKLSTYNCTLNPGQHQAVSAQRASGSSRSTNSARMARNRSIEML